MSTQENKRVMETLFAALAEGDGAPLIEAMAEDFCWRLTGDTAWSGVYQGKDTVRKKLFGPLFAQFATRYTNTLTCLVAEGDYVVAECHGEVTTVTGEAYNNRYCWLCRFADGQLKELTEYMDTELVSRVLVAPGGAARGDGC
ncbi:nuclear transport factor 2 family protein [Alloalcanivorax xenomutans]|uniref:nuclear transport factor 2 family protein n=1 Tax=Alloalcanivorax xenomutans TaxID=1094342 RepID=UPI00292E6003|nr:nuclear transport factor 2 family protein [Alloalcanivorax xenomutans]WOA31849.1 nuclear transport factor 2 family protein [Alloalcanivorax xenomutans]